MAPTPKRFSCHRKICFMCSRSSPSYRSHKHIKRQQDLRGLRALPSIFAGAASAAGILGVLKTCPARAGNSRWVVTARLVRNPKRLQKHVFCDGFEGLAPSSVALTLQRNGAMEQGVRRQFFQNQAPGFSFWRPVHCLSLALCSRFCQILHVYAELAVSAGHSARFREVPMQSSHVSCV